MSGPLRLDISTDLDDRQRLIAFEALGGLSILAGNRRPRFGKQYRRALPNRDRQQNTVFLDGIDTSTEGGLSFVSGLATAIEDGGFVSQQLLGVSATPPYVSQSYLDYDVLEAPPSRGPTERLPAYAWQSQTSLVR